MTSEQTVSGHVFMRRFQQQRAEREAWEVANPELAAAWNEAQAEDEQREREAEQRRILEQAEKHLPAALVAVGVPLRCGELVRKASPTASLEAAKAHRSSEETFLLLLGGAGAGKSVAASWSLSDVLWPQVATNPHVDGHVLRRKALFVRAAELSRVTASDYDEDAKGFLEKCMGVPWLVVDDLGAERAWDGWLSRIDELVDARYGDRRKTIITSNLDAASFKQRYGERIADRIRHDGRIVSAGKDSLRRKEPTP
jgi:DNA replication protein DnaC